MDGFEADDARIIVMFGDVVRTFVDFFESTLKHSLPDIDLFFHALGCERVSGVKGGHGEQRGWQSTAAEFCEGR